MDIKRCIWVLLPLFAGGCGEREQWLVYLHTDARIPQFGDRVSLEILDDQGDLACPNCRHTVEAGDPDRWPISFGVDPRLVRPGSELHVHAQLYRADHVQTSASGDSIRGGAYLDVVARLPPAPSTVRMGLRMDCFQVASERKPGAFRSCDATTGELLPEQTLGEHLPDQGSLVPASWSLGRDRPCEGTVPDGMTCVPGGAFVMGGIRYRGAPTESELSAAPEKLVLLTPFAIDREEFTVADLARLRSRYESVPRPILHGDRLDWFGLCSAAGDTSDATNLLPLNCISRDQAAALCRLQGKRLPTEAEWEFAAGNRWKETPYSWGMNDDICDHAVISRGFLAGYEIAYDNVLASVDCRATADGRIHPWGPQPAGHPLDVTELGIRNLGGNVSEWCADGLRDYSLACPGRNPQRTWLVDPLCASEVSIWQVVRGGGWAGSPRNAGAIERNGKRVDMLLAVDPTEDRVNADPYGVGFRCAKTMAATSD